MEQDLFLDEARVRSMLEELRWPNGVMCAHCGNPGAIKLMGATTRPGLYQCKRPKCRKQFTVTVGTIFEKTRIPLCKIFFIVCSMCAKNPMGVMYWAVFLRIGYKNAWNIMDKIHRTVGFTRVATMICKQDGVTSVYRSKRNGRDWSLYPAEPKAVMRVLLEAS